MSTQPPFGQDPSDPRYSQQPPPGYPGQPPPGYPPAGYPQQGYPPAGYPQYPGGGQPAVPSDDPLVPPDFAGWFERVIGVVRRSLVPLLIIQVAVAVLGAVFQLVAGDLTADFTGSLAARPNAINPGELGSFFTKILIGGLVLLLVGLFASAASVHVAVEDAAGGRSSVAAGLNFAARRVLPLIGWWIVALLLLVVGFLLLILPGIYLAIVFGASLYGVVLIERAGIGRAFALVNPRLLPTAGRMAVFFLIVLVYTFVIGMIVNLAFGPSSAVGGILAALLNIPVGLFAVGLAVVTYAELRFHDRPGTLTPQLAAEMRR